MFMITAHGCCSASQQIEILDFHMWVTALWGNKGEGKLCIEHCLMCIGKTYILLLFVLFLLFVFFLKKMMLCHKCPFTYPPSCPSSIFIFTLSLSPIQVSEVEWARRKCHSNIQSNNEKSPLCIVMLILAWKHFSLPCDKSMKLFSPLLENLLFLIFEMNFGSFSSSADQLSPFNTVLGGTPHSTS